MRRLGLDDLAMEMINWKRWSTELGHEWTFSFWDTLSARKLAIGR